jgi:hypothetical protein
MESAFEEEGGGGRHCVVQFTDFEEGVGQLSLWLEV